MKTLFKQLSFLLISILSLSACESKTEETNADTISGLSIQKQTEYIKKGKMIAKESFYALGKQLKGAMKSGGVQKAVSYCNVKAIPMIDSLSRVHNALIKRTTLKTRNALDAPDELETKLLKSYQKAKKNGETLKPKLTEDAPYILFTAPIVINPLCLKCHGTIGTEIAESDYKTIAELYPNDKATAYKIGELRGMWSIRFIE